MSVHYQVRLKDTTGTPVAVFDDTGGFLSLQYSHKVNGVSAFDLVLRGEDSRTALFVPDAQVEIYRENKEWGLDWYLEFEGLYRCPVDAWPSDGKTMFTAHGLSYTDFLRRRMIGYAKASAGASKSAATESVMKAFVKENLGSLATVANGRLAEAAMTGLSVEADLGLGPTWTGDRAYEQLLKVLQDIAVAMSYDFDIIGTGAGLFEFRTYIGQRGTDRSTAGVDTFTALNGVGNAPVIFSRENETMIDVVKSLDRSEEANRYFVLGQGQDANRTVTVSDDATLQDDSPWNLCEAAVNATVQGDATALPDVGSAALAKAKPKTSLSFKVLQQPAQLYGKHYTWGDVVTIRIGGVDTHMKIVGMTGSFGGGGEQVEFDFEEVA